MEQFSQPLASVIEFGVGLAGFSAIVAVFLQRSNQLTAPDRYRFVNMLCFTLTPALVAFVALAPFDEATRWRLASAVLTVLLIGASTYALAGRRHSINLTMRLLTDIFLLGNAVAQMLNAFGWFPDYAFLVLYAGLLLPLVQGIVQFIILIAFRQPH